MRRFQGVLCVGLTLMIASSTANAFEYDEHRDATCEAVKAVCDRIRADTTLQQATDPYEVAHLQVVDELLCKTACGSGRVVRDLNCDLSVGDLVALGDHFEESDYKTLICEKADRARRVTTRYWIKALENDDHFCTTSKRVYGRLHADATMKAGAASLLCDTDTPGHSCAVDASIDEQAEAFIEALLSEIYALHLLEDTFAPGHQYGRLESTQDPFIVKKIHDHYNSVGAVQDDRLGHTWRGYGDGHLNDAAAAEHKQRLIAATAASLATVAYVFIKANPGAGVSDGDSLPACQNPGYIDGGSGGVPGWLLRARGELRVGSEVLIAKSPTFLLGLTYARPITRSVALELTVDEHIDEWRDTHVALSVTNNWQVAKLLRIAATLDVGRLRFNWSTRDVAWDGLAISAGPEVTLYWLLARLRYVVYLLPDDDQWKLGPVGQAVRLDLGGRW